MEKYKFDGVIFGNGMTLNLFDQLKVHIPKEKQYLFSIDEFLRKFISNKLPFKEEQYIEKVFYRKKSIENSKKLIKLKDELRQFYLNNDANIERVLGCDLFKEESDIGYDTGTIKSLFPALYNMWFNLVYRYITDNNFESYIENFYKSIKSILSRDDNIYTTNFDYLSDKFINTKHIHGKFEEELFSYNDVVLDMKGENEFYFKTIWGHNGIGKVAMLQDLYKSKIYNKYFDFSFLFGENRIDSLLIYGLSFQRSGYIDGSYLNAYPKYEGDNFMGTVIDEHILLRISALQNLNKIKFVTVSYFFEEEKDYLMRVFQYYDVKDARFIHTSQFSFKIE